MRQRLAGAGAALLISGIGIAGALSSAAGATATPPVVRVALYGAIHLPGTDSFTLTSKSHTVTVMVTASTLYVEPGVSDPTFANVKDGLMAGVRGSLTALPTSTSPAAVTAAAVFISPKNRESAHWVVRHHNGHTPLSLTGTAGSTGTDGFTLLSTAGSIRIHVDGDTLYFESGITAPSFQNVTNGEAVTVTGRCDQNSSGAHPALEADAIYIGTPPISQVAPVVTTTTTTLPAGSAPANTAAGELYPGGTVSDVTNTSFLYTLGDHHVTVEIESYTKFFLNGVATTALSLTLPGVTVGTSGRLDPASTSTNVIVDANHVYLSTLPPVPSTTTTSTTTTTIATGPVVPTNTSAGELYPGGAVSGITSTSFIYTLGDHVVTVAIESYTRFFLNGVATTAASLALSGVTVGTSGVLDPLSTPSNVIVDANHVYLTT